MHKDATLQDNIVHAKLPPKQMNDRVGAVWSEDSIFPQGHRSIQSVYAEIVKQAVSGIPLRLS